MDFEIAAEERELVESVESVLAQECPTALVRDVVENGSTPEQPWKSARELGWTAIDLPAELFKTVTPRYDDLYYLAHVRQIDTGDKEVQAINDRGWFSLVIGNRLPQADKSHRVFLVSWEGHQDRLLESWQPENGRSVRLAVLGTWGFTCEGSNLITCN